MPELWPELAPILAGHSSLGRDANGRTLYAERVAWVSRQDYDRAEQDFALACFEAIEGELAEVQIEEAEERERERRRG